MDEHTALAEKTVQPTGSAGPAESDGELLIQYARTRDDRAFAELVARHGGLVYALCRRRLPRSADVDDVFQAAFLALAMQASRLDGSRSLAPWLYRVTWRICRQVLRSDRRRRWHFGFAFERIPAEEQRESMVDLDAALASLAENERAAIVLCHLEGLSRAEAAKQLGIPEGTLSARLARGIEKLRRRLGRSSLALWAVPLVAAPPHLQAAVMDSVRQLPHGPLEAFASQRTLELAKGESEMRWLNRIGPVAAALALTFVMLTAAWGVVQSLAQEPKQQDVGDAPPKTDKPREIAKAVAAMQRTAASQAKKDTKKGNGLFARLIVRQAKPTENGPYLTFQLIEGVDPNAGIVYEGRGWSALEQSLRRSAKRQFKRISVELPTEKISRMDANQIVNECKRAGFTQLSYYGPKIVLDPGSDNNARDASYGPQRFSLDLTSVTDELPDWKNGWYENRDKIASSKGLSPHVIAASAGFVGGLWGPGHDLVPRPRHPGNAMATRKISDAITFSIGGRRTAGVAIRVSLSNEMAPFHHIDEIMQYGQLTSGHHLAERAMEVIEDSHETAKSHGVKITVDWSGHNPAVFVTMFDPLSVNRLINYYKRHGVMELNYIGPPIFTGEAEAVGSSVSGDSKSEENVEITLDLQSLTGELPDNANGWEFIPRKGPRKREPTGGHPRQ